jgi:hypothetical protein
VLEIRCCMHCINDQLSRDSVKLCTSTYHDHCCSNRLLFEDPSKPRRDSMSCELHSLDTMLHRLFVCWLSDKEKDEIGENLQKVNKEQAVHTTDDVCNQERTRRRLRPRYLTPSIRQSYRVLD